MTLVCPICTGDLFLLCSFSFGECRNQPSKTVKMCSVYTFHRRYKWSNLHCKVCIFANSLIHLYWFTEQWKVLVDKTPQCIWKICTLFYTHIIYFSRQACTMSYPPPPPHLNTHTLITMSNTRYMPANLDLNYVSDFEKQIHYKHYLISEYQEFLLT